jgi:hypothetical protein
MAKTGAERQKKYREQKKRQGDKPINFYLDQESTERLEKIMDEIDDSIGGTFSSLLRAGEYILFTLQMPGIVTKYSPEDSEGQKKKRQKQRKSRRKKKGPVP